MKGLDFKMISKITCHLISFEKTAYLSNTLKKRSVLSAPAVDFPKTKNLNDHLVRVIFPMVVNAVGSWPCGEVNVCYVSWSL